MDTKHKGYTTVDHANGYVHEGRGFTVFEDTQGETSRFYSFLGTMEDGHKTEPCSLWFDTFEEAEDWALIQLDRALDEKHGIVQPVYDAERAAFEELRRESGVAGDLEMADICLRALEDGDEAAIEECRRVIADAKAQDTPKRVTVTDYEEMRWAIVDAFHAALGHETHCADWCLDCETLHNKAFDVASEYGWCASDGDFQDWALKATSPEILAEGLVRALRNGKPC